jgi:dTDP-4-amino-4,6-dideoxygalactose transaminase
MERIPYVNLAEQHRRLKTDLLEAAGRVLEHGGFILGEEVAAFESEFAAYCETCHAVGVASGTDAITLSLKALGIGPGDEVITAPNSFLASASAIVLAGARPVFADVRDDFNLDPARVEAAITPRTRAVLAVHLTGRPADMDALSAIAEKHHLALIEDAAQAVGARYGGRRVGSLGVTGCFSLHPLKNLSACGDGGVVTTNDEAIYRHLLKARNHGLRNRDECEFWSPNSRLDALQAALLRVKLRHLDSWTEARRRNAAFYRERLTVAVRVPVELPQEYSVYHTFVIQADRRDDLKLHLEGQGIETKVHYPIAIHMQEAARALGYKPGDFPVTKRQLERILSLPVYPELRPEQLGRIASAVLQFYAEG